MREFHDLAILSDLRISVVSEKQSYFGKFFVAKLMDKINVE